MNKNELNASIKAVKESLKRMFTTQKFSDFVLSDGTKITTAANDLEIGAEIYAVDEMGNQTPLDNGSYVLNDGRTIEVEGNMVKTIEGGRHNRSRKPSSRCRYSNSRSTN